MRQGGARVGFGLGLIIRGLIVIIRGLIVANLEVIGIAFGVLAVGAIIAFYFGEAGLLVAVVGGLAVFALGKWADSPQVKKRRHAKFMDDLAEKQAAFNAGQIKDLQGWLEVMKACVATNMPAPGKPKDHIRFYPGMIKDHEKRIAEYTELVRRYTSPGRGEALEQDQKEALEQDQKKDRVERRW